ncbi:MAG TPA: hypothetical protein VKL40_00045 [Candidatus Angelobacter sp.]|nr:hypothetical protein [Candidatus Angelobacter sp.]
MRKISFILLAVAFVAGIMLAQSSPAKSESVTGWITDAKCAAKGGDLSNADCAKKCAEAGEKLVLVTDKDKKILAVENQDALKGHEGHYVNVTGTVTGDTIHVTKVAMAKEPKPAS